MDGIYRRRGRHGPSLSLGIRRGILLSRLHDMPRLFLLDLCCFGLKKKKKEDMSATIATVYQIVARQSNCNKVSDRGNGDDVPADAPIPG